MKKQGLSNGNWESVKRYVVSDKLFPRNFGNYWM